MLIRRTGVIIGSLTIVYESRTFSLKISWAEVALGIQASILFVTK